MGLAVLLASRGWNGVVIGQEPSMVVVVKPVSQKDYQCPKMELREERAGRFIRLGMPAGMPDQVLPLGPKLSWQAGLDPAQSPLKGAPRTA